MSLIVADTSPLVALNQISLLSILPAMFGAIVIPEAVADEALSVQRPPWIEVRPLKAGIPTVVQRPELGRGEREAISLALEVGADRLIIDDLPARRLASVLRIPIVGTAGLLLAAKRRQLIPNVREPMTQLEALAFRLHPSVRREMLASAGEAEY